jgi:hypothetical protein
MATTSQAVHTDRNGRQVLEPEDASYPPLSRPARTRQLALDLYQACHVEQEPRQLERIEPVSRVVGSGKGMHDGEANAMPAELAIDLCQASHDEDELRQLERIEPVSL